MRPNVHYTLERLPSIKRALKGSAAVFKNIYTFEDEFDNFESATKINKKFVEYVLSTNFEIIFTAVEWFAYVSVDTVEHLKLHGINIVSMLGDEENNFHININYLGLLSIPLACRTKEYKLYKKVNPNTKLFLEAISFYDSKKYLETKKTRDVIFIGKPYGCRPELLQYLHVNGVHLEIYGEVGWGRFFNEDVYKGFIDNSDYHNEVAKSKIVLGLLESPSDEKLLHVNAKPFDAAKTGSALIVTRYNEFFEEYQLQEGVDLLAYSTKEELLSAIKGLLSDDEQRQYMANSLRSKIKSNFDYDFHYKRLFSEFTYSEESIPPIKKVNIFFANLNEKISKLDLQSYDYIIFKGKHVEYSNSIANVLAAHVDSSMFVKMDTTYKGRVARKIFNYVDIHSVAIPVSRFHELKKLTSIINVKNSCQTFIPLNNYNRFSFYIISLIVLKFLYKRLVN